MRWAWLPVRSHQWRSTTTHTQIVSVLSFNHQQCIPYHRCRNLISFQGASGRRNHASNSLAIAHHSSTAHEEERARWRAPANTYNVDDTQTFAMPVRKAERTQARRSRSRHRDSRLRLLDYITADVVAKVLAKGALALQSPALIHKHGLNLSSTSLNWSLGAFAIDDLSTNETNSLETCVGARLHDILADHLERRFNDAGDTESRSLVHEISLEERRCLDQAGVQPNDLLLLVEALTTEDSHQAAQLIRVYQDNRPNASDDFRIVQTLIMHTLHRRHVSAGALEVLTGCIRSMQDQGIYQRPTERLHDLRVQAITFYCIFQRIFWHASFVCPADLEPLAELAPRCMPRIPHSSDEMSDSMVNGLRAMLTTLYNNMLYQLAKPVAGASYKSILYQEAAQAQLLRAMAQTEPYLDLDRCGYRAVLLVQLMQPKTNQEQQWAGLKTLAWPPWKEDKTGIDALIGLEQGTSRAGQVLRRMLEAGYPHRSLENLAQIHTGWDSDNSPTIQNRKSLYSERRRHTDVAIWAARIRSTRTLQEAWACFLACDDSGLKADGNLYLAIFEKLVHDVRRQVQERTSGQDRGELEQSDDVQIDEGARTLIYPGDGLEVWPKPPSTHLETYTKVEPPSFEILYEQLKHRGIAVRATLLSYIMANTPSWRLGIDALTYANKLPLSTSYRDSAALAKAWREMLNALPHPQDISPADHQIMAAIVHFLLRFSRAPNPFGRVSEGHQTSVGPWTFNMLNMTVYCVHLLQHYKPPSNRVWNTLFEFLAYPRVDDDWFSKPHHPMFELPDVDLDIHGPRVQSVFALNITFRSVKMLERSGLSLDLIGLQHCCTTAYNAAFAAQEILDELDDKREWMTSDVQFEQGIPIDELKKTLNCGPVLTNHFYNLIGQRPQNNNRSRSEQAATDDADGKDAATTLPRLRVVPGTALLHAYVRALGSLHAFKAMQHFFEILRLNWPQIEERKAFDRGGDVMIRRMIVAARIFLEHGRGMRQVEVKAKYVDDARREMETGESANQGKEEWMHGWMASAAQIKAIREIIESMGDAWGGWPDSRECAAYLQRGKRHREIQWYNRNQ